MNKLNEEKFNLWKFEMTMVLAFRDLWDIVDEIDEAPASNIESKMKKKKIPKTHKERNVYHWAQL